MSRTRWASQRKFFPAALLLAVAVTVFAQVAAFAQMPGGGSPTSGAPPPPGGGAPENPGAVGANSEQATMQNMADQSFVRNTMENDERQIRLSELAQQKSSSPDVKQFGQQMVKVHTELDTQLQPVASQLGVNEPKHPQKKEKQEIDKLQGLSGEQFDDAYLQAMAREQRQSLKLFHDETQDTENKALQQAAQSDTTVLAQNLQILEKIAQAHNVDVEGKEKQ